MMHVGDVVQRVYTMPGDPPSVVFGDIGRVKEVEPNGFFYVQFTHTEAGPYVEGQFRVIRHT